MSWVVRGVSHIWSTFLANLGIEVSHVQLQFGPACFLPMIHGRSVARWGQMDPFYCCQPSVLAARRSFERHGASTSKQHIVLVIVMAHKPWIGSRFVTIRCQSGRTHAWTKLGHMHGLSISWAESLEWSLYMALPKWSNFSHCAYCK